MILTESDRCEYFPSVNLEGDILNGAIRRAQTIAESNLGAGRPLESQQYTEILSVNSTFNSCQLSYYPVSTSSLLLFEIRYSSTVDGFGRVSNQSQWVVLTQSQYQIDYETGRLQLFSYSLSSRSKTEVRATYTSGFNFNSDSYQIREIKTCVGAILGYLESMPGKNVTFLKPAGIAFNSEFGQIPDYLLTPLRKYRPRGNWS